MKQEPKQKSRTAVEWLKPQIELMLMNGYKSYPNELEEVFEIAKEMEKQQIIESGNSCAFKQHLHSERINKMSMDELEQYDLEPSYTFGEEYYNETFNK
jgi:hypothetical protein